MAVLSVIPAPKKLERSSGAFVGVPKVQFSGVTPADRAWLRDSLGRLVKFPKSKPGGILTFHLDPSVANAEGYRLNVTAGAIDVAASSPKGLYWSIQTLRQLADGEGIPCVSIEDAPEFAWRGVLLDEGRHFMGPKFVRRFLDTMSMYKFNVLHWHLTDDQGWRIEIKSHPELTRVGAWRREADGTRTGGFYTQQQVKEILRYAASRNILIVPEIEMPGHSSAAIAANPWLSCTGEAIQVPATWGVFGDVYCPGKESTFRFLDDVIDEVSTLFPSPYLHIGGDEVPKKNWAACPLCQERIRSEGLPGTEALQGYFTHRIAKSISRRGKTAVGWNEVLKGGAPDGMVVQIWEEQNIAKQALEAGHRIVLSPQTYCYLNRSPGDLPIQSVYGYRPMDQIDDPTRVMGLETTLWSENITAKNCLSMFLPRGLAMAEIFWRNPEKDWADFKSRLPQQLALLDKGRIEYGSPDRNLVRYTVASDVANRACRLEAEFGVRDVELRYTLDGKAPSRASLASSGVIRWPAGQTLRVAPFKGGRQLAEPSAFPTALNEAYGAKAEFITEPKNPYRTAGAAGLTDGLLGTGDFHDGIWLGWQGADFAALCDLGVVKDVHEVGLHCLQQMRSWILMPSRVRFEVSLDGENWTSFGEAVNSVPDSAEPWIEQWFTAKGSGKARFLRITATNYGKLPSWHNGAGGDAWIFVDEMSVR